MNQECPECGLLWGTHKLDCGQRYKAQEDDVEDEQDFLEGKTCNPNAPEECESCQ